MNKLILWSVVLHLIPEICVLALTLAARGSISRAKISCERGHPSRVSFVVNWVDRAPPVSTLTEGLE